MLNLTNNIIVINRGDTYEFTLNIEDENSVSGNYRLVDDDVVYFGIMDPHQMFEDALVKKRYTVDDYISDEADLLTITIKPEDTIDLIPGKYYYAIKLKMDHLDEDGNEVNKVITIINKSKFIICD